MNGSEDECIEDIGGKRQKGKRPPGGPRLRWVDDIEMDFREIGWGCMDWIDVAQDRDQWRALVNTVMNLRVP
jgi:peptidoglycan/xylan/chitin deacetylase (PgdA/CDA1 family)